LHSLWTKANRKCLVIVSHFLLAWSFVINSTFTLLTFTMNFAFSLVFLECVFIKSLIKGNKFSKKMPRLLSNKAHGSTVSGSLLFIFSLEKISPVFSLVILINFHAFSTISHI